MVACGWWRVVAGDSGGGDVDGEWMDGWMGDDEDGVGGWATVGWVAWMVAWWRVW